MSLKAYEQHGLVVTGSTGNQITADCPFCGKEDHLFANREDGRWDCKSCMAKGNVYSFLQKLYALGQEQSSISSLRPLSINRQIPIKALKAFGVTPHPLIPESYLLPHYNPEGKLANLYLYQPKQDKKFRMMATAGCSQHLFRTPEDVKAKTHTGKRIFLAEGHWDAIVARDCLDDSWIVRGLVGGAFKADWLPLFEGDDVYVACDNDPINPRSGTRPGEELKNRVVAALAPSASRVCSLKWDPDNDVNDLRDYYIEFCKLSGDPEQVFTGFIEEREHVERKRKAGQTNQTSSIVPENALEPLPCDTIEEIYDEFSKHFSLSGRLEKAIAIAYAVHAALPLPGRPLWVFLVGGASSGKTTIVALLEDHNLTYVLDHLTGLHSGLKRGNEDVSLIPEFNGKTVVFKDWTNILSLSPGEQERILREFRDIYDGRSRAKYRNKVDHIYESIMFNMLIGTTPRVHAHNRAELGERFLKYEVSKEDTREVRLRRATQAADTFLDQVYGNTEFSNETLPVTLRRKSKGFCQALLDRPYDTGIKVSPPLRRKIIDLASLVSISRTKAERQGTELLYRPEAEGEPRLTIQLLKLMLGLCHVLRITPAKAYPIVKEVAFSTAWSFQFEIMETIYKARRAMSTDQLVETMGLAKTSIQRHLVDMKEIGSIDITHRTNTSGRAGRRSNLYALAPEVHHLFKEV